MIEIIYCIIAFLILWIPAFYLHELCHLFELRRQGSDGRIDIWTHNGIPSMRCVIIGNKPGNVYLFRLAGGFYSGLILLLLSAIFWYVPFLSVALGLLGFMNLAYSPYEMLYSNKHSLDIYMKIKNIMYLIGIVIGLIIYSNMIMGMIF